MTAQSARLNSSRWKIIDKETITVSPPITGTIKLCICTAIWGRHEVFKLFAKGVHKLKTNDVDLKVIVSGSEGTVSRETVESEGFIYIETPNTPLSKKHNEAIKKAREFNPDYVMLTGSDDVLSPDAFKIYIEQIRKGIDFIGITDFYFWDTSTKRAAYWGGYRDKIRTGHTCGAFRCFSKRLMNIWQWQPFEVRHSHVLDNSTQIKLQQVKHTHYIFSLKQKGVFGVDIKSEINMTPFKLWDNTTYIDGTIIKNKFTFL